MCIFRGCYREEEELEISFGVSLGGMNLFG